MRGEGAVPPKSPKGSREPGNDKPGGHRRKRHARRVATRKPRTRRAGESREAANGELVAVGVAPQLIPEGDYQAIGGGFEVYWLFNQPKLAVVWIVMVPDKSEADGFRRVRLSRHYNIKKWLGRGRFQFGEHSDYMREWIKITQRRPSRHDRIAPSAFKGVMAKVVVRTVTTDREQKALPAILQYSVVAAVIGIVAGGGRCR